MVRVIYTHKISFFPRYLILINWNERKELCYVFPPTPKWKFGFFAKHKTNLITHSKISC